MKALRFARSVGRIAVWVLGFACLAFFVAVGIGPRTGRYSTLTVLSGSMRPTIPEGAMVVVTPLRPSEIRVGQILTFAVPEGDHQIVSHRVIEIVRGGDNRVIRTQGDANEAPDPWVAVVDGDIAWQVRYAAPGVGRIINWLRQPLVHRLTVLVIPLLLAVIWLVDIWRPETEASPDLPVGSAA